MKVSQYASFANMCLCWITFFKYGKTFLNNGHNEQGWDKNIRILTFRLF